jgi:hypothetical protein
MRWVGHIERMGKKRKAYKFLVGNPEGRRLVGRLRRKWEDNITISPTDKGFNDANCVHVT